MIAMITRRGVPDFATLAVGAATQGRNGMTKGTRGAPPLSRGEMQNLYVQIAELEIDPVQLEDYKAAVEEQIATAVSEEAGVLVLYAVAERENPSHVRVFEIYRDTDAYRSHLESAHFKKYKAATAKMVKSLKLIQATPVVLGAKDLNGHDMERRLAD
ncbi:putative quinol monooxygenase [Mesorhizobium loti]|uniref:putative quinol monooxygenase n=1 Tax=Rhizobium loti TaxID=381 RepID=UPI000688D57F|nr:antibiotic biosynthesis monooxygenase [Mesorhizobium loti]